MVWGLEVGDPVSIDGGRYTGVITDVDEGYHRGYSIADEPGGISDFYEEHRVTLDADRLVDALRAENAALKARLTAVEEMVRGAWEFVDRDGSTQTDELLHLVCGTPLPPMKGGAG